MDISVFNLLMSTNSGSSVAENMFSSAVQSGVPANAETEQTSLRTGEAFLQALEQARTGKTEKSAETFFNTLSARADASSSLKNLTKGKDAPENVKVVKLHIKRTKPSDRFKKADDVKNVASGAASGGQKIPTQENIAPVPTDAPVQPEQNATVENSTPVQFNEFSQAPLPATKRKEEVLPTDELTAADILISSALQQTVAPTVQNETVVSIDRPAEKTVSSDILLPQENEVPVVRPTNAEHVQKAEIVPETKQEIQTIPATLSEKTDVLPDQTERPDQKTDFIPVKEKHSEKRSDTIKAKTVEQKTVSFVPEEQHFKTTDATSTPVKIAKKENVSAALKPVVSENETDITSFKENAPVHEARRQAEQLAAKLPVETKIAITVNTQTPTVKAFVLPQKEKSRVAGIKKESDGETKMVSETDNEKMISVSPSEKAQLPSAEKESAPRLSTEPSRPTEQQNNLAAIPVENKVLPSTSTTSATEGQVAEINAPTSAPSPAAVLSAHHEIRGKAVSGNVPVQKNIPVNELIDQIKVNIKKAIKDGLDKIEIVLKPKELGTIKIRLEIGKDGSMKAILSTARAETLDLLQSDLSALKQALADNGFDLNDQSFSFNYRGERYDDEHKSARSQDTFSAEETDEDISVDSDFSAGTLSISGRYALNIRV